MWALDKILRFYLPLNIYPSTDVNAISKEILDIKLTGPSFLTRRMKAIKIKGRSGISTTMAKGGAMLLVSRWKSVELWAIDELTINFGSCLTGNNDPMVFPINIKYPIQNPNWVASKETSTRTTPSLPKDIRPMSPYMIFLSVTSRISCNSSSVVLGSVYFGFDSKIFLTAAFLHFIIRWLQWSVAKAINVNPMHPNCNWNFSVWGQIDASRQTKIGFWGRGVEQIMSTYQ